LLLAAATATATATAVAAATESEVEDDGDGDVISTTVVICIMLMFLAGTAFFYFLQTEGSLEISCVPNPIERSGQDCAPRLLLSVATLSISQLQRIHSHAVQC
jgi:hypothetical protein